MSVLHHPRESLPRTAAQAPAGVGLSRGALIALVIGSMIGSGIFGLPSQMASTAAPGPLLIGWAITGVGMLTLALVFQRLSLARPDIEGGVYGYARAGFGNYVGFTSAWGYWVSAWIGNVGYFVLLFATLGTFFPVFEGGNTAAAVIGASVLLWLVHALVLRGIRGASLTNLIVTVAKIVPLLVFIGVAVFAVRAGIFTADFWGRVTQVPADEGSAGLGSTLDQVRNMMLVTVWVFIGVEGASIYSQRAARRADVGLATVVGFGAVLALLLSVNLIAYGAMPQAEIAALDDPSLAGVMRHVVGPWGETFIAVGLVISLAGAFLAWILLCAEILRLPGEDHVLPGAFARVNAHGTPTLAMWLTSACIQAMLIWTYFNAATYTNLIYLASSLVLLPYLWTALYQLVLAVRGRATLHGTDLAVAAVASVYAIWLVYAGGLEYLLVAALAYLLGTVLYVMARREVSPDHHLGLRLFTPAEYGVLALLVIGSVAAVIGFVDGSLTL